MWAVPQLISIVLLPFAVFYQLLKLVQIHGLISHSGGCRVNTSLLVMFGITCFIESAFLVTWFVV